MDYTNESRQLKKRLQQLSINRRLRLLYYMIWVCQPSDIRRVLWTRRPGRIPSCLGDQLEFQKYEQAYAKFTKSFSAQDRNFINRLTTAQNRRYISSDNDANINAGIRILNQRLQKAQEAREQFFRDTEHIDVIPPPATGSADVGSQFSMLGSHDTWKGGALAPVISDRSSSTVSVSLEPLSFKHKFQFGLNVVEKRFALLPNARRSFLGFLASSLASDLLLLISERFNYMHDRLCTFAKLQFAIMALFGIFLGFPYTFPYYMLRYIAFFAFTLYLSSVYTKVNQDLWTVCREVNAITGRFGVCDT